jgi:hypothetical protein
MMMLRQAMTANRLDELISHEEILDAVAANDWKVFDVRAWYARDVD